MRPGLAKRVTLVAGKVALLAIASIALAAGGAWMFLQTRWGGQAVRHFVLPRVNARLAGKLELGRFSFGGDHVTLTDVALHDPSGAVVARVVRIDLAFSRLALLRRHLDIGSLALVRPALWLVQDQDGLNLARALAPRSPSIEKPSQRPNAPGAGITIDLHNLTVTDGTLDLRSTTTDPVRHIHVAALSIDGLARADTAEAWVGFDLAMDAHGGHLDARGDLDLRRLRARGPGLNIRARDLDLSQLSAGAPPSRLAFELSAQGGGRDLSALAGSLDFRLPAGPVGGQTLGPVRLSVRAAGGGYALSNLRAVLPGVEINGTGTAASTAIDLHATIDATDLAALSRGLSAWGIETAALAGRGRIGLALGGRIDAPSLRATGDLPRIRVNAVSARDLSLTASVSDLRHPATLAVRLAAKASLPGGRLQAHRDLSLALEARTAAARAQGRLEARGLGVAVSAHFDLPAEWPIRDRHARLLLEVTLPETDLADTAEALASVSGQTIPTRLRGRAHLTARLNGTLQDPRLTVSTSVKALAIEGQPIGDVDLVVRADSDRPLEAHLRATPTGVDGAHTEIDLRTPLSLRAALRHPPTVESMERTPVEVRGDIERLPLAVLAQLARRGPPAGGTVTAHLALSGTARDPRGTFTADVVGATAPGVPPTDARLELQLDRDAIDAHLRMLRQRHPLLALETHLGDGLRVLRSPALLANAPLRLRAVVGPLELQRLGLPPCSDREPPRALKGRAHLDAAIDGTLRAPRIVWHADADDIRLDRSLVGVAHLEGTYADGRASVEARLQTMNQGELRAVATTAADLGYPAIAHGIDVRHLPLDVHVNARRFDLQGLSGATQELRTVGGLVSASANLHGTVIDPRLSGQVEWSDGLIAITGIGEYKDIHLAAHGDEQKLILDELVAKSANGVARITGDGTHASGGYHFQAGADVNRFPIYQEGQPLAQVSLRMKLTGSAAPFDTRADVAIDDARIELSDAKRKNLQPLASPADVVLVDAGQPLNRAQADRLRALVAARPRQKGAPAPDDRVPSGAGGLVSAVRVTVDAPRKIWVTGKDAYFEIGLSPGFRVSMTDRTRIVGQVVVKRGRVDILGRRFDLKADSTLAFNGLPERPTLDLTAQYQNQLENITVVLTAQGPIDHLAIAVTSPNRPDLSESQLYTLIVTGHLLTSGSSTPTAEAASFLGGVLAARLQKTLAKKLPLDVLTIDAGSGEGLTGTQLEAGRYVADKLYVGYVGRVGADPTLYQNRNAVHLEYQLSARWGIDGEYGDVGTGSLDLTWKKNY